MEKYCGISGSGKLLIFVCILDTLSVLASPADVVKLPFNCYACHFKPTPVSGIKPEDDGTPDCYFSDNRGPQTFKTPAHDGETMCYTKTIDGTGFIKRHFVDAGTSISIDAGCVKSEETIDGKSQKVEICYCDTNLCNGKVFEMKSVTTTGSSSADEETSYLWLYICGVVTFVQRLQFV